MVQNSQEPRWKYWATRSSICSFARTTHSLACSTLLASLVRSSALVRLLAHFAHSLVRGKVDGYFTSFLDHSEVGDCGWDVFLDLAIDRLVCCSYVSFCLTLFVVLLGGEGVLPLIFVKTSIISNPQRVFDEVDEQLAFDSPSLCALHHPQRDQEVWTHRCSSCHAPA